MARTWHNFIHTLLLLLSIKGDSEGIKSLKIILSTYLSLVLGWHLVMSLSTFSVFADSKATCLHAAWSYKFCMLVQYNWENLFDFYLMLKVIMNMGYIFGA